MPKNNNEPACRLDPYDWKPGHGRPGPRSVRCPAGRRGEGAGDAQEERPHPHPGLPEQEQAASPATTQEKSRAYQGNGGTLAVKEGQVRETILKKDPPQRHRPSRRSGAHFAAQSHRAGALPEPDAQGQDPRHPGGLPDHPKNSVRPELTKMYYPDYTPAHYNDLAVLVRRLCGPERRAVHLHAPVLRAAVRPEPQRARSGGGLVYRRQERTAYYGANATRRPSGSW